MNDWRSQAWFQIHQLAQLLGPDDLEVKRRERMFSAIDAFSHPAHKEAQFHQLEGATRMEADLLRPMLEAEHVRAHVLPKEAAPPPAASTPPAPGAPAAPAANAAPGAPAARASSPPRTTATEPAASGAPAPASPQPEADDGGGFGFELSFDGPAPAGSDPLGAALAAHASARQVAAAPAPVAHAAPRVEPKPAQRAPEPEPPRSEFVFVPIKDKKKGRGDSPAALYKEAMTSWNEYQVNENKGTADARGKARAAAKSVRDVVLKLGKMPDADSQMKALLAVVGLSEQELLQGELEKRLR